ncbi:MAG: malate dehydrogenase [Candidatus Omnitrophica bacterium]|nr:malate dehydrogenase [Candidatus Omnitrophota bacterium]
MKIGIVGAGNVGGTLAMRVLEKGLGEIVLLDVVKGVAQGKALDMNEAGPVIGYEPRILGTDDYEALKAADIVVVTAGFPRTPGMSREELLEKNLDIVYGVTRKIVSIAPDAIIIVVTNPLDLMTYAVNKISGFPRERVIGMGGALDGTRLAYFISEKLNVSVKDINPMVIGAHSDSMVVLPKFTTVSGKPLPELLGWDDMEKLVERTKHGGAEVVKLLKKGSSFYASSAGIFKIIESIVRDKKDVLPCSFFLNGEYGIKGICIGVPIRIGRDGVKEVIELNLDNKEGEVLRSSAKIIEDKIRDIDAKIKNKG